MIVFAATEMETEQWCAFFSSSECIMGRTVRSYFLVATTQMPLQRHVGTVGSGAAIGIGKYSAQDSALALRQKTTQASGKAAFLGGAREIFNELPELNARVPFWTVPSSAAPTDTVSGRVGRPGVLQREAVPTRLGDNVWSPSISLRSSNSCDRREGEFLLDARPDCAAADLLQASKISVPVAQRKNKQANHMKTIHKTHSSAAVDACASSMSKPVSSKLPLRLGMKRSL